MSRIACFYPGWMPSAWSCSYGIPRTLKRMGHEVVDAPLPMDDIRREEAASEAEKRRPRLRRGDLPKSEALRDCDLIIVSGTEHIGPYIDSLYPDWSEIKVKKASLLHESCDREDYPAALMGQIERVKRLSDVVYCPAVQDEKYGFKYLPFGVDTDIFKPDILALDANYQVVSGNMPPKKYDLAFIGWMYGKRKEFVQKLMPLLDTTICYGKVQVEDLGGVKILETAELYAQNLREIKVFVNLPTLSQLVVTKVYEVMACGTYLLTPACDPKYAANWDGWPDDVPDIYTDDNFSGTAERIKKAISDDSWREETARKGCEEVHAKHRLDQRLEVICAQP